MLDHQPLHFISDAKSALSRVQLSVLPPLALYVHIPWCVRKCPYCDFNSHQIVPGATRWDDAQALDPALEQAYIDALILDLERTLPEVWGRRITSIFIGGGTPSVVHPDSIDRLLSAVRARLPQVSELEVTMEANPGTLDASKLHAFRAAGVTRLSLGVQSFDDGLLERIGRIHSGAQARSALDVAFEVFDRVNLDLMFALPGQTLRQLKEDVAIALAYQPTHLSYYHLTVEPNTLFEQNPPVLPHDELALDMQDWIDQALTQAGLSHYEVSAFARPGFECAHNRNYWLFGDYIGIGAGAHGKVSAHDRVVRTAKFKHPKRYMEHILELGGSANEIERPVERSELPFEFMLNALRLREGTTNEQMYASTGLTIADIQPALNLAQSRGLMHSEAGVLRVTDLGWRFLSDVQALFLDET